MHGRNKQKYEATDLHTKGIESSQKMDPIFGPRMGTSPRTSLPSGLKNSFIYSSQMLPLEARPNHLQPSLRFETTSSTTRHGLHQWWPPPLNSTGQPFWGLFQLFHPRPIGWSIPNIPGPFPSGVGFCDKPRKYHISWGTGMKPRCFFNGWVTSQNPSHWDSKKHRLTC